MFAFKHKRWGEHSILHAKELADEYKQKYGVEAALRFYEKEYAILARLFDDDSLIAFTCINLMSPEQMVELEKRLKEKREQLRKERNDTKN
jgi:hypothetical protein